MYFNCDSGTFRLDMNERKFRNGGFHICIVRWDWVRKETDAAE